jgi:hypothetical protein
MAQLTFNSQEADSEVKPFPVEVKRISTSTWGCSLIGSAYLKKYKVGQGSYGFEFAC